MGADRHVGGRAYQQDQVVCLSTPDLKYQLLVVADGVGGHSGGEMASKAVIDVARRLFPAHLSQFSDPVVFLSSFVRLRITKSEPAQRRRITRLFPP